MPRYFDPQLYDKLQAITHVWNILTKAINFRMVLKLMLLLRSSNFQSIIVTLPISR